MLLVIFKKIDAWIGTPICALLGYFSRFWRRKVLIPPEKATTILVVKLVALGDWVLILPLLNRIKHTHPNKHIAVMASPRVRLVLENQPFIDEIIYIDPGSRSFGPRQWIKTIQYLRHRQFDCVVELTHYYRFVGILLAMGRTGTWLGFDLPQQKKNALRTHLLPYHINQHELVNFMQFAGPLGCDTTPPKQLVPLPLSTQHHQTIHDRLNLEFGPDNRPLLLIHPGCSPVSKLRHWRNENWIHLVQTIIKYNQYRIAIIGGPDETAFISLFQPLNVVHFIGKLSLHETCALIEKSTVYIGLDTGPTHLAGAHGNTVIALFGPNTPIKWGPIGKNVICLYTPPPCSPCIRQYDGMVPSQCTHSTPQFCMNQISVDQVLNALK